MQTATFTPSLQQRSAIVERARVYLHTPYQHQGRKLGVGVDCAGLLVCVAKDLQLGTGLDVPVYGRNPQTQALQAVLAQEAHLVQDTSPWLPGQICLIRFAQDPQHLAVVGDIDGQLTIIHAYSTAGAVVEHRLADVWRSKVVARYEFPAAMERV